MLCAGPRLSLTYYMSMGRMARLKTDTWEEHVWELDIFCVYYILESGEE